MIVGRIGKYSGWLASIISILIVLAGSGVAVAQSPPTASLGPICINGLTVSLNGGVSWGSGGVGTITLSWGDGTQVSGGAVFPNAHTYASAGSYSITVTATNLAGTGSTSQIVNVGPYVQTCSYTITPQPIAPSGSLVAGQTVTLTITVKDVAGQPLSGAPVWLAFHPTAGGGTAAACCYAVSTLTFQNLRASPQVFVSGVNLPSGEVSVRYTASTPLPVRGTDVLTVANAPSNASVTLKDSYSFGPSPRIASCTPPNGATITVLSTVTCQFKGGSGLVFVGWGAYLFSPPQSTSPNQTFTALTPGTGKITVFWDQQGAQNQESFTYQIMAP